MDAIDWVILAVLYLAVSYGMAVLFWDVVFPAIAGEDEGDE